MIVKSWYICLYNMIFSLNFNFNNMYYINENETDIQNGLSSENDICLIISDLVEIDDNQYDSEHDGYFEEPIESYLSKDGNIIQSWAKCYSC